MLKGETLEIITEPRSILCMLAQLFTLCTISVMFCTVEPQVLIQNWGQMSELSGIFRKVLQCKNCILFILLIDSGTALCTEIR